MKENLSFYELIAVIFLWLTVIIIVHAAKPLEYGWFVDVTAIVVVYWLSKTIILKKD